MSGTGNLALKLRVRVRKDQVGVSGDSQLPSDPSQQLQPPKTLIGASVMIIVPNA
jgi:hypothetical protein